MEGLPDVGAVGWVHYRLGGGWKALVVIGVGYMVLAGGAATLTSQIDTAHWSDMLKVWTYVCLVLQGLNLLIAGPFRVWLAVMHDGATGMLESHRLMPLRPWRAIFGYLTGGVAQIWILALASLLLQLMMGVGGGLEPLAILMANLLLLTMGVLLWTVMVLWAMMARWVSLIVGAVCTMAMFGGGFMLVLIVPGAWMFGGTLIGSFDLELTGDAMVNLGRAVAVVIECAFTALFFIAAARKYRHSAAPAFGPGLGLPMMALWVAASSVGMIWHQRLLAWRSWDFDRMELRVLIVAGLVSSMLVALAPVISAARWAEARAARRTYEGLRYASPGGMVTIIVVLLLALTAMPPVTEDWYKLVGELPSPWLTWVGAMGITSVVVVSFVATAYWGMRLIIRNGMKGWPLALGILGMVGLWLLPLFVEAMFGMILRDQWKPTGLIAGISPAGTLAVVWSVHDGWATVIAGTAVQALVAAMISGLGIVLLREKRPRQGLPVGGPPLAPPVVRAWADGGAEK